MTSISNLSSRPRFFRWGGFTLLEIMLVLGLIAILFIGLAPVVSASLRERKLRGAMAELSDAVRLQRLLSQENGFRINVEIRPDGLAVPQPDGNSRMLFTVPGGANLSVRYPGGKWVEADGQPWEFSPAGLVTPLSVRLDEGDDWIEADFDLLTGRVADERYAF